MVLEIAEYLPAYTVAAGHSVFSMGGGKEMAAIMGFESFYERRSVSGSGAGDTGGSKKR